MTKTWRWSWMRRALCGVGLLLLAARAGRAELSASYDGTLAVPGGPGAVAGALLQQNVAVTGTLAVEVGQPDVSGVYFVNGQMRGTKLTLSGTNASGMQLRWRARQRGETLRGKVRLRGPGRKRKGTLTLARRHVDPPATPPVTCDSAYFTGQVMGRVLQPVCANCHSAGGAAQTAALRVTAGDPLATQASIAPLVDRQDPASSRLLQKPLNLLPHGGGQQLSPGSDEHEILLQWATLVATGQHCSAQADVRLVPLPANELLVRAAMDLRGRRPLPGELDAVEVDAAAYDGIVDRYLHSPEFLDAVKDLYDDALLVRREDDDDQARDETWAIYGEALELIAWIVGNDRPFTEIGTADYTVANDLFQRDPDRMPFPMEPVAGGAWQPTHYLDGRPHAGVLSTSAFYEVWDTNNTNKNRRRANRWSILFHCYNFLDTPVDVTRNVDNNDADAVLEAVTARPDCKACHSRLDPLASFLFPMDDVGFLEDTAADDFFSGDPERWRRANRRPPAVYGMPGTDLADMGRLLTQHPKFAECQTRRAFQLLFLREPATTAELTTAADLAARWGTEDGWNFRTLVARWMRSDVYRGRPETDDPAWVRRASPERLEQLVADLTGFLWTRDPENDQDPMDPASDPPRTEPIPRLTSEAGGGYKIILGGVNGVNVSGRSYSLNASVAVVQRKIAALAADHVLRSDLALPDAERKLLAGVRGDEEPVADEAAVRGAIVRLARRLYGQRLTPGAPQVDGWLRLYTALHADSTQGGTGTGQVPGTAGERAWRGLLTAMLRSPRILLY
jgi:hypothetical protein